jgi:hypothetical protein
VHALRGGCHCGSIRAELELTRSPDSFHPRACDCDFCRKHAAAWVSDPEGSARIRISHERRALTYRQGSGQAELLLCGHCGILVAALYRSAERLYAAINARIFHGAAAFGSEQPVSPKTLSERQKAERWQDIWFSNVTIDGMTSNRAGASQP